MIEFALGGVVIGGFLGILLAVLLLNIFPGRWGPWSIVIALAFAPFASAQHVVYPQCVTPVQVQTHYNAPAVAQYHANSPVIALFLDSYYLSQNPVPSIASRAEAAPSACEKRTDALEAKFDRLLLAIAERQQPPQVAPQPLPAGPVAPPPLAAPRTQLAPPPGALPFLANCVACHDSSVAASKGGGHAFFLDGKERPLSCDEAVSIYEALEDGSMPKGRKLDDQTIADVNARVRELRRAGKAAAAK